MMMGYEVEAWREVSADWKSNGELVLTFLRTVVKRVVGGAGEAVNLTITLSE